jgi:uncharacterized protein (TIGR03118 family)
VGREHDAQLVNPWGVLVGTTGTIFVADNGSGIVTLIDSHRATMKSFTVPAPGDVGISTPTGITETPGKEFLIPSAGRMSPAHLIIVTEDGTIAGWNQHARFDPAVIAVDNSASGAVYKGVAHAHTPTGDLLYAANFHDGVVEMYNSQFQLVGSFTDSTLPAGFAPFNVREINGALYVTFAMQDENRKDDVPGPGLGYVDVFDTGGSLIRRFASEGALNAPWGLAMAPGAFGPLGNAILVGNFGDGKINAFNPTTGELLGTLSDRNGAPITINGLWGLSVHDQGLYFAAGPGGEAQGLVGLIRPSR